MASIQNSLSEPLPEGSEFFKVKNQLLTSERVISLSPTLPLTIDLVSPDPPPAPRPSTGARPGRKGDTGSVSRDLSSLLEDK